jgi:hypothetical protein
MAVFWVASPPDPPLGRLRRDLGIKLYSAKQNKRFLLLFLEKEEFQNQLKSKL